MRIYLLFLFLMVTLSSFGQGQVKTIYFFGDEATFDKQKATSYAVYGKLANENTCTFKRYDLYNNLMQTGTYTDETLKVAHGKFTFFSDIVDFNDTYNQAFPHVKTTRFLAQEGEYVYGLEQGRWILYFPNGKIFNFREYVEGKLQGKYYQFDRKGQVVISGNYANHMKQGEWLVEKGTFLEIWDKDKLISRERLKKRRIITGTIGEKNT